MGTYYSQELIKRERKNANCHVQFVACTVHTNNFGSKTERKTFYLDFDSVKEIKFDFVSSYGVNLIKVDNYLTKCAFFPLSKE